VNGALLWEKRYNGPASGKDSASAVAVDGSGNVIVSHLGVGRVKMCDLAYASPRLTNHARRTQRKDSERRFLPGWEMDCQRQLGRHHRALAA